MKIFIFLGIVVIVFSIVNSSTSNEINSEWIKFMCKYNKTYATEKEYYIRNKVFMDNFKSIVQHNELYKKGLKLYKLGINRYSDLKHEEFVMKFIGSKKMVVRKYKNNFLNYSLKKDIQVPNEIDYRTKGYLTPVKTQGSCEAAWAFSATGAIEGQKFRLTNVLLPLSAQNLIDCSSIYGNEGCYGGTANNAFNYVRDVGINSEVDYPYVGQDGECRYNRNHSVATTYGFMIVVPEEIILKNSVGSLGPISAVIDATQEDFRAYRSGIYYNVNCSSINVNHAVLVVGYGTDIHGRDYWILKNSWGTDWGDNGFMLMARNQKNHCGIATMASVPVLS